MVSDVMSLLTTNQILKAAITKYGTRNQLWVVVEEMSELTKEVCKMVRGEDNRDHIAEEIADVYIMLEQLRMMAGLTNREVASNIELKINRLRGRLTDSGGEE